MKWAKPKLAKPHLQTVPEDEGQRSHQKTEKSHDPRGEAQGTACLGQKQGEKVIKKALPRLAVTDCGSCLVVPASGWHGAAAQPCPPAARPSVPAAVRCFTSCAGCRVLEIHVPQLVDPGRKHQREPSAIKNHRITGCSGLEGPSVGHPIQPPAEAGSPTAGERKAEESPARPHPPLNALRSQNKSAHEADIS